MSRTSNHVTRPSGLRQSANGQYVYANCVVTGKPTFFKPDYFAQVLARDFNGDEVKMFKGYVCKDVKKLRKAGKTDAQILDILGKFDPKAPKKKHPVQVKADKVIKPKTEKRSKKATTTVGEVVIGIVPTTGSTTPKPVTRPVYSWSDNPNYFHTAGEAGSIDFSEATKVACFYPGRNLDARCVGCPIYDKCVCDAKWTEEARKKNKKDDGRPVVKKMNLVEGCFDESSKME